MSLLPSGSFASASLPHNALLCSSSGRAEAELCSEASNLRTFCRLRSLQSTRCCLSVTMLLLSSDCDYAENHDGPQDELPCKSRKYSDHRITGSSHARHDKSCVGQVRQNRCCQPSIFAESCYGRVTQPWRLTLGLRWLLLMLGSELFPNG